MSTTVSAREIIRQDFVCYYGSDMIAAELSDGVDASARRFSAGVSQYLPEQASEIARVMRGLAEGPLGSEAEFFEQLDRCTQGAWDAMFDGWEEFERYAVLVADELDPAQPRCE